MNGSSTALLLVLGIALSAPAWTPQERGGGRGADRPAQRGEGRTGPKDDRERKQGILAAKYFQIADYDGDDWISFREARTSLGLDRLRFSVYDADRDGRITLEEFKVQFDRTLRKVGAFKPPVPNPDDPNAVSLEELLAEGQPDPEEPVVPPKATSVLELFGQPEARTETEHRAPEPERIPGPVPPFRRLDCDNDGAISAEDLDHLLLGAGLDVRVNTLIATLDENGDGAIGEDEFFASMRSAKPPASR